MASEEDGHQAFVRDQAMNNRDNESYTPLLYLSSKNQLVDTSLNIPETGAVGEAAFFSTADIKQENIADKEESDDSVYVGVDEDPSLWACDVEIQEGSDDKQGTLNHKTRQMQCTSYVETYVQQALESQLQSSKEPLSLKPFTATLSKNEWMSIKPSFHPENTHRQYKWRMTPKVWSSTFATCFLRSCSHGCVLSFRQGHIINPNSSTHYITASASCIRKGCCMRYNFIIPGKPKVQDNVAIEVTPVGRLFHDLNETRSRNLGGIIRTKSQTLMKSTPSRKQSHATEHIACDVGNETNVISADLLRKTKEDKYEEDLRNAFQDLLIRKAEMIKCPHLDGKTTRGFIQELSFLPLRCTTYTQKQIQIFLRLIKWNPDICLHVTSNEPVSNRHSEDEDNKRLLYYAVVVSLPNTTTPVTPLLEFVTNSRTEVSISNSLHGFLQRSLEYQETTKKTCYGIRHVETDDCTELISAVMISLGVGSLCEYLKEAWECLQNGRQICYVHHICSGHALNLLKDKLDNDYSKKPDSINIMTAWIHAFLEGKDLHSFCQSVQDAILICGRKYVNDEVQEAIEHISTATTPRKQTWNLPSIDAVPGLVPRQLPLYLQSPFGLFANSLCEKLDVIYQSSSTGRNTSNIYENELIINSKGMELNPHYNQQFLTYLMENIFPKGALFNHSLLCLMKMTTAGGTQACSESWNKIMKFDELRLTNIGNFITFQENNLKGRLELFHLALLREERRKMESQVFDAEYHGYVHTRIQTVPISYANVYNEASKRGSEDIEGDGQQEDLLELRKKTRSETNLRDVNLVPWGGKFTHSVFKTRLINTCSIDNQLQIMYTFSKVSKQFLDHVWAFCRMKDGAAIALTTIFHWLDLAMYDHAKTETVFNLLNAQDILSDDGNLYGCEDKILNSIRHFVRICRHTNCPNATCNVPKTSVIYPITDFIYSDPKDFVTNYNARTFCGKCESIGCSSVDVPVWNEWPIEGPPPFLVFPIATSVSNDETFTEDKVPNSLIILNERFDTAAYTVSQCNHFYAVFQFKHKKYIYDGLRSSSLQPYCGATLPHNINTIWFLRVNKF